MKGSEKQIKWAMEIRERVTPLLDRLEGAMNLPSGASREQQELLQKLKDLIGVVRAEERAWKWIELFDSVDDLNGLRATLSLIYKHPELLA